MRPTLIQACLDKSRLSASAPTKQLPNNRTMPESKAQRKARMKAEKKAKLEAKRAAAKDERALREDAERAAEVATAAIKVYVDRHRRRDRTAHHKCDTRRSR